MSTAQPAAATREGRALTDPRDLAFGSPEEIEHLLLGVRPTLTRHEVAARAGVPVELASELWSLLGFPRHADDDVAFSKEDAKALATARELLALGLIDPDSQAAMVRTWGRSFARLAEWQTSMIIEGLVEDDDDPLSQFEDLLDAVLPKIAKLQTFIWRRHLANAAARLLSVQSAGQPTTRMAVCFVDIVGYTSLTRNLDEHQLVDLIEYFEDEVTSAVLEYGGRVIKTIGDEVLFVADDVRAAAEIAMGITERGEDETDRFPKVRAGMAYGDVLSRLGDVYGPTVNIASRLTTVARPGSVLVDRSAHDALAGVPVESEADGQPAFGALFDLIDAIDVPGLVGAEEEVPADSDGPGYRFRRMRRTSVKGYSRLEPWVLRRASG